MLSYIWYSAPSFWMGGGLESRCVGRVYGADGALQLFHEEDARSNNPQVLLILNIQSFV